MNISVIWHQLKRFFNFEGGIHIAEIWPWKQEGLQQSEGKGNARCFDAWGTKKSQVRNSNLQPYYNAKIIQWSVVAPCGVEWHHC